MTAETKLPLVYSCSGASSAAQLANHIAVHLDRLNVAEMSCIAGVGGDVKPLLRTAKSGRFIVALDGCPLQCAAQILQRHGIRADRHYDLSKLNVEKRKHVDFAPDEAERVLARVLSDRPFSNHDAAAVHDAPPSAPDPHPFLPARPSSTEAENPERRPKTSEGLPR